MYVSIYACTAMPFAMLWGMELKLSKRVGDGPRRFGSIFSKQPHHRSKVIQRSSCIGNALWPPTKFGMKNPWLKFNPLLGSKVIQGSTRVNKGLNCSGMHYGYQTYWKYLAIILHLVIHRQPLQIMDLCTKVNKAMQAEREISGQSIIHYRGVGHATLNQNFTEQMHCIQYSTLFYLSKSTICNKIISGNIKV